MLIQLTTQITTQITQVPFPQTVIMFQYKLQVFYLYFLVSQRENSKMYNQKLRHCLYSFGFIKDIPK